MSCSAKMRKLSVRIDADLKASFEGTLRGIGVDPTCAMRSFAFQIVLEGGHPLRARRRRLRGGRKDRGDVGQDSGGRRRRDGVRAQGPGHELLAGREAARTADGRAGRDAVRRRHPPEGEMRGRRLPGGPGRLFSARRPAASVSRGDQGADADAARAWAEGCLLYA